MQFLSGLNLNRRFVRQMLFFKNKYKQRFFRIVQTLILLQFLFYLGIVFFSAHTHVLPDGRIISHSHPSSKTSNQNSNDPKPFHSHSNKELFYLYLTTVLHYYLVVLIVWGFRLIKKSIYFLLPFRISFRTLAFRDISLRAPPAATFLNTAG